MLPLYPMLPKTQSREQYQHSQIKNPRPRFLAQIFTFFNVLLLIIQRHDARRPYRKGIRGNSYQNPDSQQWCGGKGTKNLAKISNLQEDRYDGNSILVHRRRLKQRRGLSLEEPRSLWRLGLVNRRHFSSLLTWGMLGARKKTQAARVSPDYSRTEEIWEELSPPLWSSLEWRWKSRHSRLYPSSLALNEIRTLDLISVCWYFSHKKEIFSGQNCPREQSDNLYRIDEIEPTPTMVDETLKGSTNSKPFEAGPSGTIGYLNIWRPRTATRVLSCGEDMPQFDHSWSARLPICTNLTQPKPEEGCISASYITLASFDYVCCVVGLRCILVCDSLCKWFIGQAKVMKKPAFNRMEVWKSGYEQLGGHFMTTSERNAHVTHLVLCWCHLMYYICWYSKHARSIMKENRKVHSYKNAQTAELLFLVMQFGYFNYLRWFKYRNKNTKSQAQVMHIYKEEMHKMFKSNFSYWKTRWFTHMPEEKCLEKREIIAGMTVNVHFISHVQISKQGTKANSFYRNVNYSALFRS